MKIKKILAVLSASTIVCSTTLNSFPESDFLLDSLRAFAAELSPPYALTDGDSSSAAKTADELHTTDGWYYSLKDEQITITGYDGAETAIMIPDSIEKKKVVAVGDSAFKGNKTITSVDLGDVVTLGAIIFDGCTGLTEVTIPKSVKSTGNQFDGCLQGSSVEKVVFEEGIENIPENICFNARNVKEVVIPEKADVTDGYSIGDRAFRGTALATVILPDSLTSIGDSAFRDCAYLTEITIPGNVNTMEAHVFDGCKRLKELTIPKSVKSTGNQFDGCLQGSSIEKVVFEEGIENIPENICFNASNVKEVILPEKEDIIDGYRIGDRAFRNTAITSIDLPKSLTQIGASAFRDCAYLTSIDIPDNVTSVGDSSFAGCKRLSNIRFGTGIKSLGANLLDGAVSMKEFTLPATVTSTGNQFDGCLQGSSVEKVVFEEGIENIPDNICFNASNVKEVVIPEKADVTDGYSIGDRAFRGTALATVILPDSLTSIGDSAFRDCAYLTEITIPGNVNTMEAHVFDGCKRLKELTIPKSVKSTGNQFDGCLQGSSIEKVVFEEGIENIPENICFNASNVKEVILPEKEDIIDGYRIGDRAFRNTAITSIDLPKSLTQIGASAFRDCAYLTSIDIPDNVTSVGDSSFAGCKRLSNIRFGTGVKSLGANLLDGAVSMKEFTLPATVTSTGNQFDGCLQGSSVATLNIDGGAKKVPDNLAYNCKSLKTVNFPDSVSEIGARSFKNCNELSTINSNRKQFSFSSSSFDNCTSLEDPRFTIMDRMNTYLAVNSEQSSKNGVSNYTLKYSINADAASVSNIKINLGIPEGMTLLLDSITSKGVNVTESDIQSGIIPVDSISGEIRFSARVTDIGKYTVSANISFKNKNEEWNQLIGKTSVECPDITISVPETVNSLSADVFGFAPGGEDVELYVNDILVDTVKSSGYTSKYSANIKLPKGESGTEYKLYAICGDLKSDTVTTTYSVDKPAVTKVIFGFNNHTDSTMDITDVLTKGISPVLSYNPAYPLSFEITATNNQNIDRMFVTSTKGENIKYLEAFYNEKSGTWKAKGFFDPANHSYVPGMYNISIIEKENIVVGENYDPEKDQTFEDIPQEYRDNSSVEVIKQDGDSYLAEVTVSNGIQSDSFPIYSDSNSDGLFIDGVFVKTEEIAKDPVKYGFTPTPVHTSDDGVKADYYVYTPDSKDIVATMMLGYSDELKEAKDLWTGKAVLKMIESDFVDPDDPKVSLINAFILEDTKTVMKSVLGESYSSISKGLSVGKDFFRYYGEMAMADGNEDYEAAATALFVLKCVNTFATSALLASVGIYPPLSTIISWEIGRCLDRADEYLVDCMQNGRQFSLVGCIRYILDPSGIVYEGVLGNPVDGATVTVYYKDEATGKQIKWNAEDYEQMNPLLTDSEGKYLWDVPEGEWKVVCEMEGYDTAETEWMTIPPVRTEVNIALVSHEAPVVESVTRNGNEITMKLTKFADIKTVTNKSVSIEGFSGAFTVSPQLIDADDKYADTFILSGEFGDSIGDVSITSDVVSYAGVAAKKSAATPVETSITAGDVNDDNTVNLKDVVLINRFIAGGWNVTINTAAADVDKDGEVTLKDTVLIRRSIAGGWESAA